MHRLILFIIILFLNLVVIAQLPQSAYSFNCKKEINLPCGQTCLTLNATVPAIGSSSNQYTVNRTGCFRPNASVSTPGNALLSLDDLYTPVLILPFDFSFYGTLYNQLTVSTNGMVSFDIQKANLSAQWSITTNGSLPSNDYDRAIIMGVYHDVDIQYPNTSPDRRIKYELTGTAPHRKWVLTFYKIPCFQEMCWNKINNTYQVTLYEGLGLVEVHVFERDICLSWNAGNAMIGMQNYDRDNGIMAPGRSAWTTPRWGGLNMNEAWRFAPNDGAPLLKKVELYTPAGQLIAVADTVNDGTGNCNVSFANICPDSAGVTYLIKSTYKRIDDPNAEVYGVDTVVITPALPLVASLTVQDACPGISNGKITITEPVGPGFTYSVNNAAFQSNPVIDNLPAGIYYVRVRENAGGCVFDTSVQVNAVPLSASLDVEGTCPGMSTGTITVSAPLGQGYVYSIDNAPFQPYPVFDNLPIGVYHITAMDTTGGCLFDTSVQVSAVPLSASLDVEGTCPGMSTGTITVSAPLGQGYVYSIDNTSFQPYPVFNNLPVGLYQITVMESAGGCLFDTLVQVNAVYTSQTTIRYPKETYCNVASVSPGPVVTGIQGGTFTVDNPGLVINAATGVIDVRESDSGYYKITYHFTPADSCMNPIATTYVRIAGYSQYIWTGESIDDYWDSHLNWPCLQLPNSSSHVFIYSGNVIVNTNVTVNKLTIMPGAHLTILPGYNLTILNP